MWFSPNEEEFDLYEGRLCLDFANTMEWHASDEPTETLQDYDDLVAWAERVSLLDGNQADQLRTLAARHRAQAQQAFNEAIELREAIYRLFSAVAFGNEPSAEDLALLNDWVARSLGHLRIQPAADSSFGLAWEGDGDSFDRPLWPVALSAADLLTSADIDRVGECADDRGCGWLFYDRSRNRQRRWCSMETCGNRAKAHRHYERTR